MHTDDHSRTGVQLSPSPQINTCPPFGGFCIYCGDEKANCFAFAGELKSGAMFCFFSKKQNRELGEEPHNIFGMK